MILAAIIAVACIVAGIFAIKYGIVAVITGVTTLIAIMTAGTKKGG